MSATTTAQEVLDLALAHMDEAGNASDYSDRVLRILNALGGELFPLSDAYAVSAPGTRPVFTALAALSDRIGIDDTVCRTVMPYGLAAALLINDNPAAAAFCQQRYEELKAGLSTAPAEFEAIGNVYGSRGYDAYARW